MNSISSNGIFLCYLSDKYVPYFKILCSKYKRAPRGLVDETEGDNMNNFFANVGNNLIKSFTTNSTFFQPTKRSIFQIKQVNDMNISDCIKKLNNSISIVPDNYSNSLFKSCNQLITKNVRLYSQPIYKNIESTG